MMLVEERIGLWRFLPIYASLRHSEEPAEGENRGSYFMVTYDGAPGELMVGIKEEHHELIGVVVSSYLQKSFVWQCLERCLGVSMNTVGWNEEEHQYTGMDGADHTYVSTTQALTR